MKSIISLWPSLGLPLLASGSAASGPSSSFLPSSITGNRRLSRASSAGWNLQQRHSSPLLSIRGGGALSLASESDDEEYDSEEEEELSEDEPSNFEIDSVDDEESLEEEDDKPKPSPASGPPAKLSIKTALQSSLIDQHLEFAASRTRTVASLKQAVSKTMRGRPPLSCIQLKYQGRLLVDDDETVDDILMDMDDDDDEDEDESDGESDIGEEEDAIKLSLTCDILPPVDSKFGIELREKVMKMSTREIMQAYCVNMAGMAYGQELQAKEDMELMMEANGEDEDDEVNIQLPAMTENHSLNIRKKAALIQKQLESTLPEETLKLMQEEYERVNIASSESSESSEPVYGLTPQNLNSNASSRPGRKPLKGGATMNVKRSLQRNLNVNWADTFRNSLLFLFFGYFGGRNSFSRTFLLLGSPLCFLIQTRPVKVAMKQLFYTIGEPPGILMSLLPAPQQRIMSLDYGKVMRGLYGEKVLERKMGGEGGEEWLELEKLEQQGGNDDGDDELEFDSIDDDEYGDEDEYDLDDDEY